MDPTTKIPTKKNNTLAKKRKISQTNTKNLRKKKFCRKYKNIPDIMANPLNPNATPKDTFIAKRI